MIGLSVSMILWTKALAWVLSSVPVFFASLFVPHGSFDEHADNSIMTAGIKLKRIAKVFFVM